MNLPALTTIPVVDPGAADGVFALLWLVIALPLAGAAILLVGGPLANGTAGPLGPPARRRAADRLLRAQPGDVRGPAGARGGGAPGRPAPVHLVPDAVVRRRHGPALRPAVSAVPAADHRGRLADPRLLHRLHGARPAAPPVLRLPQPVRRLDADAGALGQLRGAVPGLGGGRPRVVPADRLLAAQALGRGRGQEGLRDQPGGRHRAQPGGRAVLRHLRHDVLRGDLRGLR